MADKQKLSATAISTFLKSPKKFYWQYKAKLQPVLQQAANYDHDILFGRIWAEFTDRFYRGADEEGNTQAAMAQWTEGSHGGWIPPKDHERLQKALETLTTSYYQLFSPDDGVRSAGSELWVENDRFVAKLDGLSLDRVIHEVKSTSRAKSMHEQLWKIQNSIQVKLYAVLADATGHCIEFAYKDPPFSLFRGPVEPITAEQKGRWAQELNALADSIYALGDDEANFPCHTDGCCITGKYSTSMCAFQILCEQGINETTQAFFQKRISQQDKTK